MAGSILEARDLAKHFRVARTGVSGQGSALLRAVDGIGFSIGQGETLGLVGESGCGKTTVGRMVLRLIAPSAGCVSFAGHDIQQLNRTELGDYRAAVQAVFQDPFSSLDPRMRVGDTISEPLLLRSGLGPKLIAEKVADMMEEVGLGRDMSAHYPHEFSGGQRQRVAIARALVSRPQLVVLDEPVSALDVSVRAQILNLLDHLQDKYGMAYLLIAHDLAVVRHMCRQVAVMYLGKIVECGPSAEIFGAPGHPYTQALLSAILPPRPVQRQSRIRLRGEVPSPMNIPSGCRFHPRCPVAEPRCSQAEPVLSSGAHRVACHLWSAA